MFVGIETLTGTRLREYLRCVMNFFKDGGKKTETKGAHAHRSHTPKVFFLCEVSEIFCPGGGGWQQ